MSMAFISLEQAEKQAMRKHFPKAEFADNIEALKNKKHVKILSVFVHEQLSKKELALFPSLKHIITRSSGYDHINLKVCNKRGINVYNIPDYGTESVAEFTILMMLALLRKFKTVAMMQNDLTNAKELRGMEANGKILGIIGTGRIGAQIIKIANSFGMKILAYNRTKNPELIEKYRVQFVSLDKLVRNSDLISLHLPLKKETKHIIDRKMIAKMKKGVLIINTSRGALIDISALADGINNSRVGGAALDVVEAEDLIAHENDILAKGTSLQDIKKAFIGNMLFQKNNVIFTPHIAYNTEEAVNKILEKTIFTINEIEKGNKKLYNKISTIKNKE